MIDDRIDWKEKYDMLNDAYHSVCITITDLQRQVKDLHEDIQVGHKIEDYWHDKSDSYQFKFGRMVAISVLLFLLLLGATH